jgi:HEAT repeats
MSETATASVAFERFRFSFFEDPDSPRNGLDSRALTQLEGAERTKAEDMLLEFLPDARAVIGLGVLRSRRAELLLTRLFEVERGAHSSYLIYLAQALWQIGPDPRWALALIDVLETADNAIWRQTAAWALCDVHDPAAVRALVMALDDPDGLVRHHAARSLLVIHGLPAQSMDPSHMMHLIMSGDPARRESGKRDMLVAIACKPIAAG